MSLQISGFTSFANIDPSCTGQVTQHCCSSGVLSAALGVSVFRTFPNLPGEDPSLVRADEQSSACALELNFGCV